LYKDNKNDKYLSNWVRTKLPDARYTVFENSITAAKAFFDNMAQNPPKPPPKVLKTPTFPSPQKRKQPVQEVAKKRNKSTLDNYFNKQKLPVTPEDDEEPTTEKELPGFYI
jgi:hypothetical protein